MRNSDHNHPDPQSQLTIDVFQKHLTSGEMHALKSIFRTLDPDAQRCFLRFLSNKSITQVERAVRFREYHRIDDEVVDLKIHLHVSLSENTCVPYVVGFTFADDATSKLPPDFPEATLKGLQKVFYPFARIDSSADQFVPFNYGVGQDWWSENTKNSDAWREARVFYVSGGGNTGLVRRDGRVAIHILEIDSVVEAGTMLEFLRFWVEQDALEDGVNLFDLLPKNKVSAGEQDGE